MKRRSSSAFTLFEVITAMAVVVILAGLVIHLSPYVFSKCRQSRGPAEIAMLSVACESYKADFGTYPEDMSAEQSTNQLKPKKDFQPTTGKYALASRFLYKELTGDKLGAGGGGPDGIPEKNEPRYLKEFDPKLLKTARDGNYKVVEVQYIQDPFGYPYGYSTAAARGDGKSKDGFNRASFDLWCTGGSNPESNPTDDKMKELEWAKWIKNW